MVSIATSAVESILQRWKGGGGGGGGGHSSVWQPRATGNRPAVEHRIRDEAALEVLSRAAVTSSIRPTDFRGASPLGARFSPFSSIDGIVLLSRCLCLYLPAQAREQFDQVSGARSPKHHVRQWAGFAEKHTRN